MAALAKDHVNAWSRRWGASEIQIVGDDEVQRFLRFATYHLVAAANPDDEHASIGARGLTGQDYRGHVFWDTEIYLLPFYLLTDPPAARAVWQYWRATADDKFMVEAGADILFETARFWASRARTEADGHAHIRTVIGPDEYHETVDDNAYTNVMARWNLNHAADAVAVLKREQPAGWRQLSARLALTEDEPAAWQSIA